MVYYDVDYSPTLGSHGRPRSVASLMHLATSSHIYRPIIHGGVVLLILSLSIDLLFTEERRGECGRKQLFFFFNNKERG